MGLLTIIEITIGVVLILAVVSILTTAAVEALAGLIGLRGLQLLFAIGRMVGWKRALGVMRHPLVKTLRPRLRLAPSYLRSTFFSRVLGDILQSSDPENPTPLALDLGTLATKIEEAVGLPGGVKEMLAEYARRADQKVDAFQTQVEEWYDAVMERVEGWYTRSTRFIAFVIGFLIAASMNIDIISLTTSLSVDPDVRSEFVTLAKAYEAGELGEEETSEARALLAELVNQTPAIGWTESAKAELAVWRADGDAKQPMQRRFLSWFLVALAATLGAPFWFDLLSKLMRVRSAGTGSKREEEQKALKVIGLSE